MPVTGIGTEVKGDVRMVLSDPRDIKTNKVVCSRMKQEVSPPALEALEVAADKDIVCHLLGQLLEVFPFVSGCQCLIVVDRPIRATQKSVVE